MCLVKAPKEPKGTIASADNNYLLPKVIMCACFAEASDSIYPFSPEGKKLVANLKRMI